MHEQPTPMLGDLGPAADLDDEDELLTVHDAATWLKVPISWIYEHTRESATDRLPAIRLGKYVRFRRSDLRAYLHQRADRAAARSAR